MPKHDGETYLEYRERLMEPVSSTFCAAKWANATIWLGSGRTTSCHHPPAQPIDLEEIKERPQAIHNTKHKKAMRKMMLEGERPPECEYCWKVEDIGRNNVSDRILKTVIYSDEDIKGMNDWQQDYNLRTLEIAFDRVCNFACSYCNPSFSTTWAKDIKENGYYDTLVSDGAAAYQQDGSWAEPYKTDANPYVDAFWRWWPELKNTLQELRVTGGEPLLSPHVWRLFEQFKNDKSLDIQFSINSNLGIKTEMVERMIDYSYDLDRFTFYTSNESVGKHAEYSRDGLDYDLWLKHVEMILERASLRCLTVMMTINALALYSLPEFLDQILRWKERFGKDRVYYSANLIRFPSFMSPLSLPDHLKTERRAALLEWFEENKDNPLIIDAEKSDIQRLIDYLEVVETPHGNTSELEKRWQDFGEFYRQYDRRRNKSFINTFPSQISDWFQTL